MVFYHPTEVSSEVIWAALWVSEYLESFLAFFVLFSLVYVVYIRPSSNNNPAEAGAPGEVSRYAQTSNGLRWAWDSVSLPRRGSFDRPEQPLDVEWNASFRYPLIKQGTEVRLLAIKKTDQGLVTAKFHRQSIDTLADVDYDALSYTWGADPTDNKDLRFIAVEEGRFCVRRNLFDFLLSWTTDPDLGGGRRDRLLFVDAVCIDQHDEQEKGSQVRCMRDIYGQARRVVIWIDRPDNPAIDYTELDADKKIPRGSKATTMSALFNNPYWSRVWIVEEVLLARQLVLHSVGKDGHHKTIDVDAFIRLNFDPETAVSFPHEKWLDRPWLDSRLNWGKAKELVRMRRDWVPLSQPKATLLGQPQKTLNIREIIHLASVQECKIIADHVYGFAGLLDTERYPISPDYAKSNKDIYVEVVVLFIAYIHTAPWESPQALMTAFESDSRVLRNALRIDDKDKHCHDVTRLLLQLGRIPIRNSPWQRSPGAWFDEEFSNFSKPYQEKAYSLPADQGITPFLQYLAQDWQYLRQDTNGAVSPDTSTRTVGDVLGMHRL